MKFRHIIFTLAGLLAAQELFAQQNAQYTQYIFNGLVINPAYAGSKEVLNANALYRTQWAGLEGAPTTQTLSLDGAILNNLIGLGFQAENDRLGAQGQLSFYGNASVRLNVTETGKLSFGLAGGASQYFVDGSKLTTAQANDPAIAAARESTIVPEAKAGLYFNTEKYYIGLSASNLIAKTTDLSITPARHYYLTSGYVFDLGENLKLKPSFLIKEDFNSPTNLDLNAFILLQERLWLGASYRTGLNILNKDLPTENLDLANAAAVAAQLYVTRKIRLGYSYDITLTALSKYASHEVSLGYYFYKKEDTRMLTPRYF